MTASILTNSPPKGLPAQTPLCPAPQSAQSPTKGFVGQRQLNRGSYKDSQCCVHPRLPVGHVIVAAVLYSVRLLKPVCSDKSAKTVEWGKIVFSANESGTTRYPSAKETPISHYRQKSNSRWIKDLNVRAKTIKILLGNIGVTFCDLGLGNVS